MSSPTETKERGMTKTSSLCDLSDEEFRQVVDDDLRGKADAKISPQLRKPENVDRWYSVLLAMTKSVEGQLAARRSDWDGLRTHLGSEIALKTGTNEEAILRAQLQSERERYLKWRAGIIRFKTGLDEWLAEARHLRDRTRGDMIERVTKDERAFLSSRVRTLEEAIRRHRDHLLAEDLDDEAHEKADEALWSLVQ